MMHGQKNIKLNKGVYFMWVCLLSCVSLWPHWYVDDVYDYNYCYYCI